MERQRTSCACGTCKRCRKREYDQKRYLERRAEVLARGRAWYEANKQRKSDYDREYREAKGEERLAAKRAYYEANRDEILAKQKEYYQRTFEARAARGRDYYQRNRERILGEYWPEHYRRNREAYIERTRRWNEQNPERRRASALRHVYKRARVPFTDEGWEYRGVLAGDPCSYCGASMEHVDHIVPIALGGDGDWINLTAACGSCNMSKNARPLLGFLLDVRARSVLQAAA